MVQLEDSQNPLCPKGYSEAGSDRRREQVTPLILVETMRSFNERKIKD